MEPHLTFTSLNGVGQSLLYGRVSVGQSLTAELKHTALVIEAIYCTGHRLPGFFLHRQMSAMLHCYAVLPSVLSLTQLSWYLPDLFSYLT